MNLRSISIEHFGPFRARQTLPLADLGLVLVRGRNEVSAAASSNGAGKSMIWDALAWCWFGVTTRGQRADEVACRFTTEPCEVEVEVESDTGRWLISRGRRPAMLALSEHRSPGGYALLRLDAKETQARIEALLGFGFRTFCNAVMFGQGAFDRFASADQGEQLRMLDEIRGLDLRGALKRATDWRDEWRAKADGIEGERFLAQGKLDTTQRGIKEWVASSDRFEAEKGRREKDAQANVTRAMLGLQTQERLIHHCQVEVVEAEAREAVKAKAERLAQRLQLAKVASAGAERLWRQAVLSHETAQQRLEELMAQDRCPTCRRPIKTAVATDVSAVRKAHEPDLKALHRAVLAAHAEHMKCLTAASGAAAACKASPPPDAGQSLADAKQALGSVAASIEAGKQVVKDGQAALDRVRAEAWTGAAGLADAEREAAALQARLGELTVQARKAEATVRAAEYWTEAFGDRGIRNLLLDGDAAFLNDRLAHHLGILTVSEATVTVSPTAELKKGGTKDRLTIGAEWAWGAADYAGGSAGQDRRVDLALFAALQDLAESRSARPFPLKIWDEPGDALDERGKEVFARWVEAEARARGTGFLVTHSEELAQLVQPDRTWTVVLTEDGARVETA